MSELPWDKIDEADESGGGKYSTLKPDTYDFKVVEAKAGDSKAGNPMITATLEVEQGPDKGTWVDMYITYTEAAAGMFKQNLKALGVYEFAQETGASMNDLSKMITGKRCRAKIINREGDDRTFNNVKGTLKAPSDGEQPETATPAGDPF